MHGGEIFVPKIPSARITDLAQAMAPKLLTRVVGIRPGEKLHEVMWPSDDSYLTLEFEHHFVIRPTITFADQGNNFTENKLGERGVPVARGFEYNSGGNGRFLTVPEIVEFNHLAGLK